ncbi:hypothetical protein HNR62_001073 [Oceanisphaera litoralis]|uniref:hypothetical protein n=1 Tax=Oceanisphaera litoralis TaxID=225144 RepID=UPI00195C7166|nr:hypothetical protein [Oceanisphaera litoralis]MBM7455213.1 hypothetical protein [Oceanisphaera litoralis]
MPAHLIDTRSTIVDVTQGRQWPSETRIDQIGQNGPTGEHYDLDVLYATEARLERGLVNVREQIREYVNQHNLNKQGAK